jgi:3-oxoadipate enol-lactonase/4-carboxymuconolactone decarboxylase
MSSVELHFRDEGPRGAPALVLLGSLGSDVQIWDAVTPELSRNLRVIRVDTRGHGGSPVPAGPYTMAELGADVIAVLDRLELARAHVCGISLGGMIGMWLAAHAPERVERLSLLCTSARLAPRQPWLDRAALVRKQGTGAVAEAVVGRWLTPAFAQQQPALAQALRAQVASTPAEGYAACCEAIASWDGLDGLHRIVAPTLVVAGEKDPAIPPLHAQVIAAGIARARLTLIEAAHMPLVERPRELARLLLAHAGDVTAAVAPSPEQRDQGERIRREVLGDAHVDRAQANTTAFTAPFQEFVTRIPWGTLWARPGLSRPERSIVTLTTLAILHHDEELAMHVKAALRNGLSVAQIQEILLHIGVYAGVPVANRAFAVAQRALQEAGVAEALAPPPLPSPEST